LASLHLDVFSGYPNALLGRGYAKAFIEWFAQKEEAIAIAALDSDSKIVGYALGAPVGYAHSLNRDLFWVVAVRVLLRPWVFMNMRFWTVLAVRVKSVTGFCQEGAQRVELPEPVMSLVAIGVDSSKRKQMIGQRLMEAFEDRAHALNMRSLVLSVYESGTAARRFYEKCGWQEHDRRTDKAGVMRYFKVF
jgi:ribosomal protein S18 acetylase RimI-like enzyme